MSLITASQQMHNSSGFVHFAELSGDSTLHLRRLCGPVGRSQAYVRSTVDGVIKINAPGLDVIIINIISLTNTFKWLRAFVI